MMYLAHPGSILLLMAMIGINFRQRFFLIELCTSTDQEKRGECFSPNLLAL